MDSRSSERHMTLEMRLLSFSTGQPHPHAEKPIIFITQESVCRPCNVLIEIDVFFIVRWRKGDTYCLRPSERGAYAYFSFLSEDTLVIPNLIQNTLEIVKIAIESDDTPRLVFLCILNLPALTQRASIVRLGCRAEPNPTGSRGPLAMPAPSSRPFRDNAEDAIILFNVLIEDVRLHAGQFHSPDTRLFTFIVHRRALLGHIPAAYRECAPFCSIPEPPPAPAHVPWAEWGVTATRWFECDPASMRWITTTAGQRAVTMEDVGAPTPIIVRDFNPYMVRSARGGVSANGRPRGYNWSAQLPNGNRMAVKVEESVLSAGSVFKEDVRSSLPYVEIVTRAEYRYEGVLMDEERILGMKTSQEDKLISSFDVHILG
ncbi:hypothetical protein BC826DRAFT_1045106 [Russula brevipes]|nr:hypothetical protein BC826DRAFT_1045106 [Russula brevipes]